ncbi:RHS repeat-associated core domain-containing protein [Robbsia sp. KACC 23696]|uniref:RHS repeat-associated core domain-containing protein n=1 Tax=Robbsia sp. KACC 23696 TaxID=3149231 RepID=UPI00325B0A58
MVGNPVAVNIGNKYEATTDFTTVGQDPLIFSRHYNSLSQEISSLGAGWRSNFDRHLRFNTGDGSAATMTYATRADGAIIAFEKQSNSWYPSDGDVNATLTSINNGLVLTDSNDNVETYSLDGRLTSVISRSGYGQTLTYDANNNLSSVVDSYGRSLTFTFVNGAMRTMTTPDGNVYTYNTADLVGTAKILTSVVYPGSTQPTVVYVYDDPSYPRALTGIIDENGKRYATWGYDQNLRAVSSMHAGGADATTLSYNFDLIGTGYVTSTNAFGKVSTYDLTWSANIAKVSRISTSATANTPATTESFAYDGRGYISSHTDKNGNVTNYVNDARGHIISQTDAVGTASARTVTTTWDSTYNLPTQIAVPGLTTDFTYTGGLLSKKKQTDTTTSTVPYSTQGTTRIWTYAYYPNGLLHTVDGPLSGSADTVSYVYDAHGCLASVTNELGETTSNTSINGRCQPLTSLDPNGITTNFSYDDRGRVTAVTINPGANQSATKFTYDPAGNLTVVTFPDNSTLSYSYDDAHRLVAITNTLGESINYALDALGNRTATTVKSASSVVTAKQSATFDELGRMMANIGAASQTVKHAYDANNNETSTIDPRAKIYGTTFDALNRVSKETDPNAFATVTTYNAKDEVIGVTDARELATTYVRNGFGDVIQQTSPDTGADVFWYDAHGNPTKHSDARGVETDATYDALDRILTKSFPPDPSENQAFYYDSTASGNKGVGSLTSFTDQSGSTSFEYDALGRVVSTTNVIAGKSYVSKFAYDAAGRVTSQTYPSGRVVNYTRDAMGHIAAIDTQQTATAPKTQIASSITYAPYGDVTRFMLGNGLIVTRSYDLDYQPTGISASAGTATVQSLTNVFDASGNITSVQDAVTAARNQTITYDNLNRVATATGVYGSQSYGYDSVGNRLTRNANGASETLGYSTTSNRLNSVTTSGAGVRSLSYAASGQVVQDVRDSSHTYGYTINSNGRPAAVTLNGAAAGSYLYNASEQRVQKIVGATTTQLVFDETGALLEEADGSGAALRDYIWLDDIPVALVDNSTSTPSIYYVHTDQLNTPQKVTDAAQTIVWDNPQDPFGISAAGGSTITPPGDIGLRFSGQYFDVETGLHQNWNRDYDPTIGRYAQSDPVWLGDGVNIYTYVNGNPVGNSDPTGEFGLVGAAIGAGVDLGIQLLTNDGRFACVDWTSVGLSAIVGALTGGLANGSFAWKTGSNTWSATRKWLAKDVWDLKKGQNVHHWFIEQNSAIGKVVPDRIKNQPWNLNPMRSALSHSKLHRLDPVTRTLIGAPGWAQGAAIGGGISTKGAAFGENCGCR